MWGELNFSDLVAHTTMRRGGFTLLGFDAVIIHTHCALLSYWIGKFGDVKVPDGPWRLLPHVFTVDKEKEKKHIGIVINNINWSVSRGDC